MRIVPMEVDVYKFVTAGEVGFIRLGMSKTELESQRFPPDGG